MTANLDRKRSPSTSQLLKVNLQILADRAEDQRARLQRIHRAGARARSTFSPATDWIIDRTTD